MSGWHFDTVLQSGLIYRLVAGLFWPFPFILVRTDTSEIRFSWLWVGLLLSLVPVDQLLENVFRYHYLSAARLPVGLFSQYHGLVVLQEHVEISDRFVG
jgi:hypothetical protein